MEKRNPEKNNNEIKITGKHLVEGEEHYCFIDSDSLISASKEGWNENFNRLLRKELFDSIQPNAKHLVFFSMVHHHKAGVRVDPHMRLGVYINQKNNNKPEMAFFDVTMEAYNTSIEHIPVNQLSD